jgi:hypothetical protein
VSNPDQSTAPLPRVREADASTEVLPRQRGPRPSPGAGPVGPSGGPGSPGGPPPPIEPPLAPRTGPGRHRPVRTFRAVGVFVLVLGAIAGVYLGVGQPFGGSSDVVVGLTVESAAPSVSADTAKQQAALEAQARAEAAAAEAAELAKRANELAQREEAASRSENRTNAPYPVPTSCAEYKDKGHRATGCAILLEQGFGLDQMPCLDKLWTKESRWTVTALNKSSGAYGIPQSLPGTKMATFGSDWKTNPVTQIKWGLDYIKKRYKTPCAAWSHSQSTGWY